jgi:hypothetical protein
MQACDAAYLIHAVQQEGDSLYDRHINVDLQAVDQLKLLR